MHALLRLQDALLTLLAVIGALAIGALMLHVFSDVTLRNVANSPIPATYEIVTNYYMIALAFVPLAWVERGGGMVQVEVIDGFLSRGMIKWSDRLVALISTAIYGLLAWVTAESALDNMAAGAFVMAQSVRVPTWPAYFLVPLGFGLAALVTAIRMITAVPEADEPEAAQ
jgi:TRAP-type C4-dicarboxylate transport system permease small subunit